MHPSKAVPLALIPAFLAIGIALWLTLGTREYTPPSNTPGASSASSSFSSSRSSTSSAVSTVNTPGIPLQVPAGFSIETFADDVPGARVFVKDGFGNYWVSQPSQGLVTQLEMRDGKLVGKNAIFRGLNGPHGLAIDPRTPNALYIAEEHRIIKALLYSDAPLETIAELPPAGRHRTRTLQFGTDGRLYASAGSTCDVCIEKNEENGAIVSMNPDGTDRKIIAKGLRNAVFFALHPVSGEFWSVDMGRDFLGDNLPPEEINSIRTGAHYGWPFCYGNKIRDTKFQPSTAFDCQTTEAPVVELPAHVAPLGITFIGNELWPSQYAYDALVAEHGSWNSTVPVGYKIVRVPLSANGQVEGEPQDFITGFIQNGSVVGRPVDVFIDGTFLFITDDKRGAVYRMMPS